MDLRALNKACFTICVFCIVTGTALAFAMIWGGYRDEFVWKSLVSVGVLFLASSLTLSVSKAFGGKGKA